MLRSAAIAVAILLPTMATAQQAIVLELSSERTIILVPDGDAWIVHVVGSVLVVRQTGDPVGNPYQKPNAVHLRVVDPIVNISMSASHSSSAANNFAQAAQQIDAGTAKTTDAVAKGLVDRGKLLGIPKTYTGLPAAIDKALEQLIGTDVRPVTVADAVALRAIAWALWEAGH